MSVNRYHSSGDFEKFQKTGALPVVTVTGATTLGLTHVGALTVYNSASGATFTVPAEADVAWPEGAYMEFYVSAAGAITFAGASGVTINKLAAKTLVTTAAGSVARLRKIGTNSWSLSGDLA